MKIIKLVARDDGLSYFEEFDCGHASKHPLGMYSKKFSTKGVQFRDFEAGATFDWHNAPQPQYIIYLEGKVEVKASGGETKVFNPGEVLFATDLTGKGHITTTLTKGRSVVVTTQ